jgi:hypothetical protein
MKMIKGVLFVFVGLFLLVTLISLLMPSKVVVARGVSMHGDSVKIFNQIADLRNWKNWQPVFKENSAGITYGPTTDQVNSYAQWTTGGKVNKLVITDKKYPTVTIALQREGENDVQNMFTLMPVQEQGNMQVQWQSITKLKWYPWEKFGGIFVEKMTGPGYEAGLNSLKEYVESHQ